MNKLSASSSTHSIDARATHGRFLFSESELAMQRSGKFSFLSVFMGFHASMAWMLDDSQVAPDDPKCLARMTCKAHCGEFFGVESKDRLCACDEDCNYFGDCCKDYQDFCQEGVTPVILHHHGEAQCFSFSGSDGSIENLGIYMVSGCPPSFWDATIRSMCDILDDFNKTEEGGVWYKNSFCRHCWESEQDGFLLEKLRARNGKRYCIPGLLGCRTKDFRNALQKEVCDKYMLPVVYEDTTASTLSNRRIQYLPFRNLDCLTCDMSNFEWDHTFCYPIQGIGAFSRYDVLAISSGNPDRQEVLLNSVLKNSFSFGLPESISILINFGYYDKHVMYSAQDWGLQCPDNEIFDPFSEVCRKLYCDSDFDLTDFECRGGYEGSNVTDSTNAILLPSANVQLRLSVLVFLQGSSFDSSEAIQSILLSGFERQFCDFLYISRNRTANLTAEFLGNKTMSDDYDNVDLVANITQALLIEHRLTDYILNFTELQELVLGLNAHNNALEFRLEFILKEKANANITREDSTDRVVAHLAEIVSKNNFQFEMDGLKIMVTSMHETTIYSPDQLENWCRGGHLANYTHEMINISVASDNAKSYYDGNWTMSIMVLESGENFSSGEFVANLMYQGVYNDDVADFTGSITVCEDRAFINDSTCPRIRFKSEMFDWEDGYARGDINFTGDSRDIFGIHNPLHKWEYRVLESGEVETCVNIWMPPFLISDIVEAYLSLILTSTSALCLLLTLLTYSLFPELRNLPGMNLMGLALSTFVYQVVFLSGVNEATAQHEVLCILVAVIVHFSILNSFFWTNVMAWDIFQTFGKRHIISKIRPKRYIRKYIFYTGGSSFLIVTLALLTDFSEIIPGFRVGYGQYSCWISNAQAAGIFIALPIAVILVVNIVLYILTISSINHVSKLVRNRMMQSRRGRRDVLLYIRIFCILGFTWLFGLLTVLVPNRETTAPIEVILVYLHVIFNGLQGLFIFSVFTTNKRVLKLYQNLCQHWGSKRDDRRRSMQSRQTTQSSRRPPTIQVHHHLCHCTTAPLPEKTLAGPLPECLSPLEVNQSVVICTMDQSQMMMRNRKVSNESNISNQSVNTQWTSLGSFRMNSKDSSPPFESNLSDVDEGRETPLSLIYGQTSLPHKYDSD